MKNKTGRLTICLFLVSFTAWSQTPVRNISANIPSATSDTRVNLQRDISLEQNSKSREVILNIEENVDRFELAINSSVTAGNLKVEVYDPEGNHQGTFSVGTQLDAESSERVQGNINKSIQNPQAGNWKVSIVPTQATGSIKIRSAYIY